MVVFCKYRAETSDSVNDKIIHELLVKFNLVLAVTSLENTNLFLFKS
jgi:hypothetical protein